MLHVERKFKQHFQIIERTTENDQKAVKVCRKSNQRKQKRFITNYKQKYCYIINELFACLRIFNSRHINKLTIIITATWQKVIIVDTNATTYAVIVG